MKIHTEEFLARKRLLSLMLLSFFMAPLTAQAFLIQENFESSSWATDQGWYDMRTPNVTTAQAVSGVNSLAYTFNVGAQNDTGFSGMRLSIPATDSVYLSFNRLYQNGWNWGSQGIHDFYLFADASPYQTPTDTKLTAYFEQVDGKVDTAIRAAQQANSPYNNTWFYENGVNVVFDTGIWHHVDAMVVMNDPGQSNGELRVWVDGELQVERLGLLLRAPGDEGIMFNQLFFGPWIGNGSPITQTFWTDDIIISSEPINTVATPIPVAAWLFGSALFGLFGMSRCESS